MVGNFAGKMIILEIFPQIGSFTWKLAADKEVPLWSLVL